MESNHRLLVVSQVSWPLDHRTASLRNRESAQRESNPHFRHGKATGYRYIMGASNVRHLAVKERWQAAGTLRLTARCRQYELQLSGTGGIRTPTVQIKSLLC